MTDGYKSGNYRKYSASGYRPSSYKRYSPKQRRLIRLRNRIIIVTCGVVAIALIITLFSLFLKNCVCAGCTNNAPSTIPTETIDTSATKPATEPTTSTADPLTFIAPAINDDGTSKGEEKNGLYIFNESAYKGFNGKNQGAKAYAQAMNNAKEALGEEINVYSMLVPTHIEMGLPERLRNSSNGVVTNSQADYMKTAFQAMDKGVTPVNIYNSLAKHCNDKIYFNTDYRWTGLGAYYGYSAFVESLGNKPILLEAMTKKSVSGFKGYYEAGYDLGLKAEPIEYWKTDYSIDMEITTPDGDKVQAYDCFYEVEMEEYDKIAVFLQGDYPMHKLTSSGENAKDKICIVHEGYGNQIASYFTYNYKEVYLINTGKWTGNLKKFCKNNDIKNVLFINDTASSGSEATVNMLSDIVG